MIFFREYRTHFHQHSPDNVTGAKNRLQTRINTGLAGDFSSLVCKTFAWFTSKDEVTNRLTANADYGVSIVESFAPPENWLPGQEVNKDVYAVNTGNVAAFVEETVSGALTITKEVADGATPTADSIKLTKAERYVVEAGAYLAYAPAASNIEKGSKVVSMIPDSADLNAYEANNDPLTDFTPDAAGLYVFRRSIGVDKDTQLETFKYDGYYFDGQDYYQITDLRVVPDKASYAGNNDFTDGNLKEASAKCVKEVTETVNPVSLAYEAKTADHPNRLVATYDTGAAMTDDNLDTLAEAYDDALIVYEDAVDEYKQALKDSTTTDTAASTANATLQEKVNELLAAEKALAEAQKALDKAQAAKEAADAAKEAADAAKEAAQTAATNAAGALGNESDEASNAEGASAWAKYNYAKAQKEAKETALGKDTDTASDAADASAWAKYKYAKAQREAATAEARNAYLDYIYTSQALTGGTTADDKRAVAEAWLRNRTYNELLALNIDNEEDVNYNYHQLVIAEKAAERAKDAAAAELADAEAALARATQAKNDAVAAKTAADVAATNATNALGTAADAPSNDENASAWAKYNYALKAKNDAQTAKNEAEDTYNEAAAIAGTDTTQLNTARNHLAEATQKLAEAEKAYNDAIKSANEGVLKININLSDDVVTGGDTADKWQLLPNPVNGGIAYFYYTSILGGGETSAQLIDSVELDSSVTDDMFKRFDFDLNVALKSAQIAYDTDGNITTDAATLLDANATLETPTSVDSVVDWTLR